jgi:phosphoglycolate phosphatase-like HAD superfamily hydrolase
VAAPPATVRAVAVELRALGDTDPLWRDWLADAARRYRVDVGALDEQLPNWRPLLERFAEERAPVYLRRDAEVSDQLRRLHAGGVAIGVFSDAPEELARIALPHLGAGGRVSAVEAGDGARERLLERLGPGTAVVHTRAELLALR